MNILFDNIIFSKEKQGGISRYWAELISHYAGNLNAAFYEEDNAEQNIYRRSISLPDPVSHSSLPLIAARLLPIKYNSPTDHLLYHSSFYRKLLTNARICEAVTVHDFIHDHHFPQHKRALHNYLKYGAIKRAKGIICVSDNTYRDLIRFCGRRADQKISVIHNGVSPDYGPADVENPSNREALENAGIHGKFLLFVGSRAHYKNFGLAVELVADLAGYGLVVVGNPLSRAEKKRIGHDILKRITVANNASENLLNLIYNKAHALIYPSSYEGFGIPVIEAMKAGCPVLALNRSAIPEIAGGAAILLDTPDLALFKRKILDLEGKLFREEVVQSGLVNARRFSWKKCIADTAEFYQGIY